MKKPTCEGCVLRSGCKSLLFFIYLLGRCCLPLLACDGANVHLATSPSTESRQTDLTAEDVGLDQGVIVEPTVKSRPAGVTKFN